MVRHMFASLHKRELYELLPENLKNLEIAELRYLCVKELNGMSKKNIYTILKGKDFVESESEGEKNEALTMSTDIKTLKTEIAVADSTTEMTAPNLPGVFQTVSTDDITACNSIMSTSEIHFAAVESISLTKTRQESETVIQSDFTSEYKISSSHYADIFDSKDTSSPNQVNAVIMAKNDDELEEGEVVSDQEKSTKSDKGDPLKGHQHLTIHRDPFAGNLHGDSSPTSMSKKSGNSGNSADTNKAREERRLHMLELELRARAIEALIRRSDSKS
ncbi:Caspase activity and apoptosis inhibitor 1 family protein [Brugia pahangi]